MPAIALVQMRPDLFPEPREFRPERFLAHEENGRPTGRPADAAYSWIPFGGGVRRCLGAAFAQFEIKVVLRSVLLRARLRAPDAKPESQRTRHVTVVPEKDTVVEMTERLAAREPEAAIFSSSGA